MTSNKNVRINFVLALLVGSTMLLSSCGGGSGSGSGATPSGSVSGMAIKGPVSGGTMAAYAVTNGSMGAQLAVGVTGPGGNYELLLGDYTGPVMLQLSGGTFVDEATGVTMSMSPGDVMTALIPMVASGETMTNIVVTPLTSMAQAMANNMAGGMTGTNIHAANTSVGGYFMVNDILHTQPMDPLVSGSSGTATLDMKNYGMAIAAMSQSAKDMAMSSSSGMITSMIRDASDGIVNGMMGNAPVSMGGMSGGMGGSAMMQPAAGTSGLASAMVTFAGSAMNESGLTALDMQPLVNKLNVSNGQLQ